MITHTAECLMTTSLWIECGGVGERQAPATEPTAAPGLLQPVTCSHDGDRRI
jgi:hypothetical protein